MREQLALLPAYLTAHLQLSLVALLIGTLLSVPIGVWITRHKGLDAVSQAERELAQNGRVVLRASGTEAVIRVMVEGVNEHQVLTLVERLASVVAKTAA